jgi:hypothetical protein
MSDPDADRHEQIDRATSTTICKAIGDRLRQNLAPDAAGLPPHLQHLVDKLRLQDSHVRG